MPTVPAKARPAGQTKQNGRGRQAQYSYHYKPKHDPTPGYKAGFGTHSEHSGRVSDKKPIEQTKSRVALSSTHAERSAGVIDVPQPRLDTELSQRLLAPPQQCDDQSLRPLREYGSFFPVSEQRGTSFQHTMGSQQKLIKTLEQLSFPSTPALISRDVSTESNKLPKTPRSVSDFGALEAFESLWVTAGERLKRSMKPKKLKSDEHDKKVPHFARDNKKSRRLDGNIRQAGRTPSLDPQDFDTSSVSPQTSPRQDTEVAPQTTAYSSDGEFSFVGWNLAVDDLGPFDERAKQWTQDFVLRLAERIVARCRQDDQRPLSGCTCCECLGTEGQKTQTVAVNDVSESQTCEKSNDHSESVASATQARQQATTASNAKKRPVLEEGEEDARNQKRRPPGPEKGGSSPDYEVGTLLACPYHKFDPLRYSSNNIREKEYRGCASSFLRDIPRLKQHLYRVHKRPNFCCSRCSGLFGNQELLNEHSRQEPPCRVNQPKYQEKMSHSQYLAIKRRQVGSDTQKQWYHIFGILFPSAPEPDSPYATAASAATVSNEAQHFANLFRYIGPDVVRQILNERQQLVQRGDSAPLEISTSELVEETFHVAFPLFQQTGEADRDGAMDQGARYVPLQADSSAPTTYSDNVVGSSVQSMVPSGPSMEEDRNMMHLGAENTPPEEWHAFDEYLHFTADATEAFTSFDPFAMSFQHDGETST